MTSVNKHSLNILRGKAHSCTVASGDHRWRPAKLILELLSDSPVLELLAPHGPGKYVYDQTTSGRKYDIDAKFHLEGLHSHTYTVSVHGLGNDAKRQI